MNQKHNVTAEKLGIQISSGTLAGLAGGAVTISKGETNLFVSATAAGNLRPGQDFFPLTVDYREKFTKAEILRRNIFHAHLFTYENDYFQYSQGLMPQEVWEAKLKALAFFYNQCDMRNLWNSRQQFFPEGYVSIIKSITDECVNQ